MSETLLSCWRQLLADEPGARALIEAASGSILTRRQLDANAGELAGAWHAAHPKLAGKRVVFSRPNSARSLEVFVALLSIGAVPVPLDPSETHANQLACAQSIHVDFLLGTDNQLVPLPTARRRAPPNICLVKLTSGSTGSPRALEFTHRQMIADGRQVCTSMDVRPGDLNLALVPFGHSYGLGNLLVPLLTQGTPLLCPSAALPQALADDIARWQATVFPAVPALLRVMTLADIAPASLRSLRVVISAGSALPAETARAFTEKFGLRIHGFYGSSETGGITYDRTGEATLEGRSVGTPLDGVSLHFSHRHHFTVSSAAVFTAGNRRKTRDGHGVHEPADLGQLNALGELTLLGRTGRMVKIASRRLDLGSLEREIKKLPGIREAFVIPHPQRAEELACALATDLDHTTARALLGEHLVAWKVPRRLIVFPEFPLTARGKTDTKILQELLTAPKGNPSDQRA